jgi:hypothetical protein
VSRAVRMFSAALLVGWHKNGTQTVLAWLQTDKWAPRRRFVLDQLPTGFGS